MCNEQNITSGARKARIALGSVISELEVDPNQVAQSVDEGFHQFLLGFKDLCDNQTCECECHLEMNDVKNCNCTRGDGICRLLQEPVTMWLCRIDEYLKRGQGSDSSNALVAIEALVRQYAAQIKSLQLCEPTRRSQPVHCLKLAYRYHKDNLIQYCAELCWRFAVIIVRQDIFRDVKYLIGNAITTWIKDSCPPEISPFIVQIQAAAFDDTQGMSDSYLENKLITVARAYDFHRQQNDIALEEYWRSVKLPFTSKRFLELGIGFHELLEPIN